MIRNFLQSKIKDFNIRLLSKYLIQFVSCSILQLIQQPCRKGRLLDFDYLFITTSVDL
jgi:hypothetical protein